MRTTDLQQGECATDKKTAALRHSSFSSASEFVHTQHLRVVAQKMAAVARYPALGVLVALLLPLLAAAAVLLAPFAIPLGVVALVFMKFTKSEEADVASRVAARPEL